MATTIFLYHNHKSMDLDYLRMVKLFCRKRSLRNMEIDIFLFRISVYSCMLGKKVSIQTFRITSIRRFIKGLQKIRLFYLFYCRFYVLKCWKWFSFHSFFFTRIILHKSRTSIEKLLIQQNFNLKINFSPIPGNHSFFHELQDICDLVISHINH